MESPMYDKKPELHSYEPELTFQEIADILGIHRNTVFNIYNSAMVKVTRYLKRRYNEKTI